MFHHYHCVGVFLCVVIMNGKSDDTRRQPSIGPIMVGYPSSLTKILFGARWNYPVNIVPTCISKFKNWLACTNKNHSAVDTFSDAPRDCSFLDDRPSSINRSISSSRSIHHHRKERGGRRRDNNNRTSKQKKKPKRHTKKTSCRPLLCLPLFSIIPYYPSTLRINSLLAS